MQKRTAPTLAMLAALLTPVGAAWAQYAPTEDTPHEDAPAVSMPGGLSLDQPTTVTVMGHEVQARKGLFEVTADLNVRAGPGTDFKRVEGLKAGDRVRAVGRTENGEWMAISKDGVTLGFAYAPVLVAVVDGALKEPFFGSFIAEETAGGVACDYRFRFERKSDVEGESFETADYEVRFRCASVKGAALFYGHMFLTEAPINESKGLHLIGLDVRSIGDGMEEYLSTSYLYHPKSGEMTFDGHTLPRYALPPQVQTFKTASVKDALQQALEASISSWTEEAWATLFAKKK